MRKAGGRREAEVPMDGTLGLGEEACSADVEGGGAGVCAVAERSGLVVLSPGLGPELHVD